MGPHFLLGTVVSARKGWLNRLFGNKGERAAARFLKRKGYRILARNARNRLGEIDLIALDGETLVFVEVKTRRSHGAGHPAEAVGASKQQQLTRAALSWLKSRNLLEHRCRFDVVAITWQPKGDPVIEHLVHAFESTGRGQMFS